MIALSTLQNTLSSPGNLTKILSLIASTTLAKEKQEVPSEENPAKAEVADNSEDCQVLMKFVHDSDVVSKHMQEY